MKILRVGKVPDRQLVRLVEAFAEKWGGNDNSQVSLAGIALPTHSEKFKELAKGLKAGEGIDTVDLHSDPSKFVVRFRRGIGAANGKIDHIRQPSPYFDEIAIEVTNNNNGQKNATAEELLECLALVQKYAMSAPPPGDEPTSATDLLNTQFAQLNGLLSEVTERVHLRQIELDEQHHQRMAELDTKYAVREADLATDQAKKEHALQAHLDAINAREAAIDNRQHMHARRDLRDRITQEIQERLSGTLVHRQSFWVRYGVLAIMFIAGTGLGAMSYFSLAEYTAMVRLSTATAAITSEASEDMRVARDMVTNGTIWYLLGRAGLSAFGAVAFLLYAIGWLKRIYTEDVRAQRDLERYSIDLSRASWAIETIMEAKTTGDVSIPDILVAGVSRNLFEVGQQRGQENNDALASFLKASIRGKISTNGAEFDFNNRGTSKLAKEVEAD